MKKIKILLIILLLTPFLLNSANTEATGAPVPDWFYVYVDVPNFPSSNWEWYAIIEITNTDLTADYYAAYGNTHVIQDLGDRVSVYVYPDEAYVKFRMSGNGGSYNGTVTAKVTVFKADGTPYAANNGSHTGQFYYNTNVPHIMVDGYWAFYINPHEDERSTD